jgi:MFS family permease|tara:strand:+ start:769 stop:2376 length:1608 start_codon:yes stop_codon:yes gene_type:complete
MSAEKSTENRSWYSGVTSYQWLVLLIASLGWVFDIFEGQIFVASMRDAMPDLLGVTPDHDSVRIWNDRAFGFFLLGGAFGGVIFGIISDRIGRAKTMIFTILFYSLFTCLSAFSQEPWHMVVLRFLVAMGVGGEWAVASAMVAEVMPKRSRPVMSSIFHASSVFGTLLAAATIAMLIGNQELNGSLAARGIDGWRVGFAIGVLPALLTLWIRWKLREPDSWNAAQHRAKDDEAQATGRIGELFSNAHFRNTIIGVALATIGLVTFWGGHIYGKNALMRKEQARVLKLENIPAKVPSNGKMPVEWGRIIDLHKKFLKDRIAAIEAKPESEKNKLNHGVLARAQARLEGISSADDKERNASIKKTHIWFKESFFEKHKANIKREEMTSMALNTIGGGLGLVFFGGISNKLGRKGAFVLYHAMAFIMMLVLFKGLIANDASRVALMVCLPIFGFFTVGMHAGYAVYFPELYPTRLRGTGTGFCFNMGRLGTAAAFFGFAAMASPPSPETKAMWLAPLFLLGVVVVLFAKETRGAELPE